MKSLTAFWNKHPDQTAFVLGSGPSLNKANVYKLHAKGIVITVNSAVMHDNYPDYHVITDGAAPYLQSFDLVVASNAVVACASDVSSRGLVPDDRLLQFTKKPYAPMGLQTNYLSQSITAVITAAHLAIVLGCKRIVLVGCDCTHKEGKRYFYDFWNPPGDDPMVNAFLKTGFERPYRNIIGGDKPAQEYIVGNGPSSGSEIRAWNAVVKLIPSSVSILDASDSRLDCFPKVQIGDILK